MSKDFRFESNLKEVEAQLKRSAEAGMEAALLMVEASAKSRARVGSGEMRDKVSHKKKWSGDSLSGQVGSPLEHAIYNEFGTGEFAENGAGRKGGWSYKGPDGKWRFTKGMTPQPFLRPAFRSNRKNIEDTIGKEYTTNFKGG